MKAYLKMDLRGLRRRLHDAEAVAGRASLAALTVIGRDFAQSLMANSPEDTARYKRGWGEAINQAGLGPVSLPAMKKSKYAERLLDRLEQQVDRFAARMERRRKVAEFWEKVYQNRYERPGRKGQWERDCAAKRDMAVKNYETAKKQHEKAVEQVKSFDPMGLVIWGRQSTDGKLRMREVSTVRVKNYGGRGGLLGSWVSGYGSEVMLFLHNLEPHASIVEKSHRVVARASAAVKRPGVRRRARDVIGKRLAASTRSAGRALVR